MNNTLKTVRLPCGCVVGGARCEDARALWDQFNQGTKVQIAFTNEELHLHYRRGWARR